MPVWCSVKRMCEHQVPPKLLKLLHAARKQACATMVGLDISLKTLKH